MILVKPKTRKATEFKTVENLLSEFPRISKNWRSLTPLVKERLVNLLALNLTFSGLHLLHKHIAKNILEMRSGTFSRAHYINIFGWNRLDVDTFLDDKGKLFKKSTGGYTPGMVEFWTTHHGLSVEEAQKKVSAMQRKLSVRKKKTTINQPTSLKYYTSRGMSEEDAVKAQSDVQKMRRNNCVEYWTSRGHSPEEAAEKISALQKLRSKLSVEYWLHRGYTLEEAQEQSIINQKKQFPGKISKISRKFFDELMKELTLKECNKDDFLYGDNEKAIFITPKRRVYLDFIHLPSKRVVEFDGKYWHSKPGVADRDLKRDLLLKDLGYSILRIPETYSKDLWNKYMQQALCFILTGHI